MQALRKRFAAVALAVLVPVGLLVWRALASVAVERQARHEIVAERVFDEMERALSDVLAREEARPFEAYGVAGEVPLQPEAPSPFLIGYFRIEPAGAVRAAAGTRDVVEPLWRARGGLDQPPAGLRAGADDAKGYGAKERDLGEMKRKDQVASSYDALRSLNKAVEQRVARQKHLADEYDGPAATGRRSEAESPRSEALDRRGTAPTEAPAAPRPRAPELPPMVGQPADAGHLVLYRTIVRDGRGYRQGMVFDLARLGTWLTSQVVGGSELAPFASLVFGAAPDPATRDFVFPHRFAEPFGALTAQLTLRPLPSVNGPGYIYALSALLLAAMTIGLVAIYRMVGVAIGFAERRSNFVAAVSHELKTPLTAIRMYGEMLRDGIVASDAKRDEYYRHITAESERLSRLINNVLEFSKLEKGNRPMTLVVGHIEPVLDEAIALLRPHVEAAGLSLRTDVEPNLPSVRFERDALLQVLFNLVDNAVKYAAGALPPEVVVEARRSGDQVVLCVRDHGPGVPAGHLERIFEPFYRAEHELTRRTKGTGLGLALVQGLATSMGATVTGRNVQPEGFEVSVALAGTA